MATVTLQPITMIIPNSEGIYAPSRRREPKTITEAEFVDRYADHSRVIQVSLVPDGVSDPQLVTAYGVGLDCWYIVV